MSITTSLVVAGVVALASIIGLIFLFRKLIDDSGRNLLSEAGASKRSPLIKKYPDVDVSKYSWLLLLIGLSFSLSLTLFAFELKDYGEQELADLGISDTVDDEAIEIPITQQPPPPPPQVLQQPEIHEVEDEEEIEEVEIKMDTEVDQETVVKEAPPIIVEEEPVKKEVVEEIFTIVEESAEPVGGYDAFNKYLKKTLKYPKQAQKMHVEGKVYVQFVVDKDGSITDVHVMKGVGAGCDEEAMRVIKESPKWKPGKQRGKSVKQRIVVPIVFKLG